MNSDTLNTLLTQRGMNLCRSLVTERTLFYVYIVQCADGSLYTGFTKDVKARVRNHNDGKGSKYVRAHLPCKLVWESRPFAEKSNAMRVEFYLKRSSREFKVNLILNRDGLTGPVNHSMHFKP